ncbi:serine hydrolase domain-containing protein [Flammeovirga agarivorans]|uniref:Beta-lactamase family protein n=1 Tax=Flammeovirga agarivorans TaxID=2726742 RepID=A0A7X8XY07_9BACT|nr:serine hydrolase domain-containing protein [Flammeovirga agarivorans]NLR93769.1 beta-lactamase family protein [Flammeovirga agarivorans]
MSKLLSFYFLLLISCQSISEKNETSLKNSPITDSLTYQLNELYQLGHINGFSVAITNEEGTLYEKGFGYANVRDSIAYTAETIQTVGSVSKTLIGIALLKAQEMGLLHLDDPINKHLPFQVENPYSPNVPITIRHLVHHTSTIIDTDNYNFSYVLDQPLSKKDTVEVFQFFQPPSSDISILEFLKNTLTKDGEWYSKDIFIDAKPGEKNQYSNTGATLAALIIEQVAGVSFSSFTKSHILTPLDMSSSGWLKSEIDTHQFSQLYMNKEIPFPSYHLVTYPDGGFITSSDNLGKYLTELIKGYHGQGTLLQTDSYVELFGQEVQTDTTSQDAENPIMQLSYKKGIFMGFAPQHFYGHTGGDPGVVALMLFNSETKSGQIFISNTDIDGENKEAIEQLFSIWSTLNEYQVKYSNAKTLEKK